MSYQNIRLDREGPVAVLTLNRPERLNAMSKDMLVEMLDACDVNDRFWLLASSSTDVAFEMRVRFLGQDAFVSPESPAFEPYFPSDTAGELVYRHPGGAPAETVIDVDSIVCER